MSRVYSKVHFRKDTNSNWTSLNPILLDGEIILVLMDNGEVRIKIGDGKTTYTRLSFFSAGEGGSNYEGYEELKALLEGTNVEVDDLQAAIEETQSSIDMNKSSIGENRSSIAENKSLIEENKSSIDINKSSIETNRSSIEENKSSIDSLREDMDDLRDLIGDPSSDEELSEKVNVLESKVDSNTSSVESLRGDLEDLRGLIGSPSADEELREEVNILKSVVESNKSSVSSLQDSVENTEKSIEEIRSDIQRVDTSVSDNSSSIASLTDEFSAVKSTVESSSSMVESLRVSVEESTSYINVMREEVSTFRSEVTQYGEDISTLQEGVITLNSEIEGHDKSIDELSSKVDTIQEEVTSVAKTVSENSQSINILKDRVNNIIGSSTEDSGANINISEVVDIRRGYDGNIYETAGDAVRAIGSHLEELRENPIDPNDLGLVRDESTGLVHATFKGIRSSQGIPLSVGGGGVGDSSSLFRLRSTTESLAFSASYGDPVSVSYTFSCLDPYDGTPTGNGTAYYYVNSNLVHTATILQGANEFECSRYLIEGANEVIVTVKNSEGESKSLTWNINCISIRLTSTFDYTIAYNESITYKYTAYGDAKKKVHFILDGVEDPEVPVITSSGRQSTKVFSGLDHGLHTLEVYAIATINDAEVRSNTLKYDIIVTTEGSVTPIISINCDTISLLQGELLDIPYIVHDPLATESTVSLDIHYLEEGEYKLYKTETRTIDRSLQHWSTRYYPIGTVKFTVTLREVTRSTVVNVDEYSLPVEPATNDLELLLSSANRSNSEVNPEVWTYEDITTDFYNVNWASSGWLADSNGDTSLHLAGGSTATIKFKPFSTDLRVFGKTLEFEFAVRDVNNRDANVISCKSGGIGIEITADRATLTSNLAKVECRFDDERKMRVSFVIESRSEYRMMSIYLDGVLTSCKQYVTTDNFQQINPVDITIGSPYCSVDLYTVRSYSTALTQEEIISNYLYDIADVTTKAEIYDRNNLYDDSRNLDYAKVKTHIPVMTITGPLPASKGDKKDVTITYEDPEDETMNFTDLYCKIDVQGTSSQWYVRKNYKLKFDEEVTHIKGSIPAKVFCVKADYAEATSTHNTQIANIVHSLYDDLTPAQVVDSRCRTTIQGFPIVIYHKESIDSIPTFLGKYNYNYDKGSEAVFGFTDDFDVECWEFCNNTSVACNFTGNIPAEYEMKDENDNEVGWVNDFERRYPEHDGIEDGEEVPNEAIARFRAMHEWVVSTGAYDLSNPDVLATYRSEFEERFNLHKVVVYYVWTFFFLMVDQRAKNMFMTYWASTGKWEPWFYDNDTCLGINNEGQMVFDYYHEDTDLTDDGAKVYNGQDSVLWNKFRVAFAKEIQETYQKLRSDGKLSYNGIRDYFVTNGSSKWSESIYNEDSDYKYISMLRSDGDATNLPQIKGTGEHHLEYFLDGRINYCDSKWYASDYANDFVVLRVNTPSTYSGVAPNANITITPFSDMYAGVRYRANGTLQQKRLKKNESYTFIAPADNFNDTETAIYGASQISSLGDLSPLYCNYCDVSKAKKLIELKLGTEDTSYESSLETLSLGTNRLLKKLDIRNCKSLHNPVDLTGCPSIEEIYAEGSSISSLNLADSGYLKVVHLPETITTLTIKNQKYIEDFSMESYENIKELRVENSPNLPLTDILLNTPLLERTRLINVEWSTTEQGLADTHKKLLACGGIDETGANTASAVVSGIVEVPSISNELLGIINRDFPELMVSVNGVILCTVSYYNYDGTLLHVTTVERGKSATDIVAEGIIDTPARATTDTHRYEYRGWSDSLDNIQKSRSFVAMYDVFYAVRFLSDDTLVHIEYVKEGTSVEDPITSGAIEVPQKESTVMYTFTYSHWDIDFSNIKDVTYVNAVYEQTLRSYTISFYNEEVLLESKVLDYGAEITYTGEAPAKLRVEYPQDYKFLGWTPELGTVGGDATYFATFSESDHILDDWIAISANVANGTYKDKYPLGILQRMVLTHSNGSTEEVDMELVGYDHDTLPDGRKAGLTFITKGILKDKHMMSDSQSLNRVSWVNSRMRQYLNDSILPALPADLSSVIVPVVKKTSSGGGTIDSNSMIETTDTLWTPSLIELIDTYSGTKIYAAEGTTYERFESTLDDSETRSKRIKSNFSGYAQRYWTRTPVPHSSNEYWMISQLGGGISTYASYAVQGVVFGFCIGIAPNN